MSTASTRRKSSWWRLCLVVSASCISKSSFVRSASPLDNRYRNRNSNRSIQRISISSNRKNGPDDDDDDAADLVRSNSNSNSNNDGLHPALSATDFDSDSQRATKSSLGSTSTSSSSSTCSIDSKGLFALLQGLLLNSSKPLLRTVTFTAQAAIAAYLAKASWNVVKEAWDELNEEYSTHYKKDDASREEQDLPFVDSSNSNALSDLSNDDGDDAHSDSRRGGTRRTAAAMTPMRDLATRLRSAGVPFAAEVRDTDIHMDEGRTVESVIKSLTRSEGNVLSQTLLTPTDDGTTTSAANAWNAIGGLRQAKESLLDLAFPLLPPSNTSPSNAHNYYGGLLANPPGVLLYGPPGCGKSMLVRALANTVGARFLVVSPSCLLRKYVGETNLNVRALFSVASKISPCVIFVDELDGLFRERGGEDHDVSRDLKTEFLQLWDGIRHNHLVGGGGSGGGASSSSSVLVIGATNRPFDVDPAFLRRMPRRIFIGLPDYHARVAVLTNMLQNVPLEPSFDMDLVARNTRGYSPSDIREVLQAAALYPLREARSAAISSSSSSSSRAEEGGDGDDDTTRIPLSIPPLRKLRTEDVLNALQVAKPTHFSKKYERDLMEYVQRSGGTRGDSYGTSPSPSVTDNIAFSTSSEYFGQEEEEDVEEYSYDESESDCDDL